MLQIDQKVILLENDRIGPAGLVGTVIDVTNEFVAVRFEREFQMQLARTGAVWPAAPGSKFWGKPEYFQPVP